MNDFTIAIYCFLDDLEKKIGFCAPAHFNRKLSDIEVITTLIISVKYYSGNQLAACSYVKLKTIMALRFQTKVILIDKFTN
jgi:hypothetical protein